MPQLLPVPCSLLLGSSYRGTQSPMRDASSWQLRGEGPRTNSTPGLTRLEILFRDPSSAIDLIYGPESGTHQISRAKLDQSRFPCRVIQLNFLDRPQAGSLLRAFEGFQTALDAFRQVITIQSPNLSSRASPLACGA